MQWKPAKRRRYPSDITDEQWRRIEHRLSARHNLPRHNRGRYRTTDLREVVNAINYRWTTGCVWRMLPHDFPHWATVYTYFRRWQQDGTLPALRDELLRPKRRAGASSRPTASQSRAAAAVEGSRASAG